MTTGSRLSTLFVASLLTLSLAACADEKSAEPAKTDAAATVQSAAAEPAVTSSAAPVTNSKMEIREGDQYLRVPMPKKVGDDPTKIEVVELFWAGCPHCWELEPHLQKWLETKPDNVNFIRVPAVLNRNWAIHAKGIYAAGLLGKGEDFTHALFVAMHEQGRRIQDEAALIRFAETQGLDAAKFTEALASMPVQADVEKSVALGESFGLTGVPALVVGGEFRVNGSSVKSYEEYFDVVDHLVAKEAAKK